MTNGDDRPSWHSGLWAFLIGGAAIALLLVYLDPVMRVEDCPNYGGNGNASAFDNPNWELGLPLVLLAWWTLIVLELALPVNRRHRSGAAAARGVGALMLAVVSSCYLLLSFAGVCH